jgi:hypothetical protein
MLGAARAILENTVTMLQLADSFDVIQISKAGTSLVCTDYRLS